MLTKESLAELRKRLNAHWSHTISQKEAFALLDHADEQQAIIDKLVKALEDAKHNMALFNLPLMGGVTRDTFIKTAQSIVDEALAEVRSHS